jgi:hypothetical protein
VLALFFIWTTLRFSFGCGGVLLLLVACSVVVTAHATVFIAVIAYVSAAFSTVFDGIALCL